MNKDTAAKFKADIQSALRADYSRDDGETFFKGQSLSYLISELRDKGWRRIPSMHFFSDELKSLGFQVVKARERKPHSTNPKACRAPCNVVTI